jgi:adenylyltransferase/sulfurtransferase
LLGAEGDAVGDEVTPTELRARLDARAPMLLLDVREPWERALCRIEPSLHIPLEEIQVRVQELDPDGEIVVYCHHGVRSGAVVGYLRRLGFTRVANLAGGIDRWARSVDATMRRY